MIKSPIKIHGGKKYLASRILKLIPPHIRYIEPYFGSGAVLFRKSGKGVAEFVNDINGDLMNFWDCLRNPETFSKLERLLVFSPLSQELWKYSYETMEHKARQEGYEVYNAWRFFVRFRQSRQGLGRTYCTPTGRLRRNMNENVSAWLSAIEGLPEAHERLQRVEIYCEDALKFIGRFKNKDDFFYCDPPYLQETRILTDVYQYEMDELDHINLLEVLSNIKGKFILSGYPSKLYNDFAKLNNWSVQTIKIDNKASSKKKKEIKEETLWSNF